MYKLRHINFLLILKFWAISLMVLSVFMIIPAVYSILHKENEFEGFLISFIVVFSIGFLLYYFNPSTFKQSITLRDSFLIIFSTWIIIPIAGMLPFILSSPIDSISDALFESFSGFTTSGFSHLFIHKELNNSIVVWKSITQWLGGMGLLIFIIALFPFIKEGEVKNLFFEFQNTDYKSYHQKISTTAKKLWLVYLFFTFIGIILLFLAGNSFFDSFTISLSTISTSGGIFNHGNVTSLSLFTKIIITILMFIAGADFYYIFKSFNFKLKPINEEFKAYFLLIFVAFVLLVIAQLYTKGFNPALIFESLFNTISFVSTTGFYTNQYFDSSILFVWMVLFFLLFIGSSAGSSGGGINIYRVVILLKSLSAYVKSVLHPNYFPQVKFNDLPVQTKLISRIFAFFVLYFIVFLVGSILLSASGLNFNQAISLCAASLSNSGANVFLIIEYFELAQLNLFAKYTMMLLMVIGRIELFPFLLIFSKTFWKV